jgi:hypothetical protein
MITWTSASTSVASGGFWPVTRAEADAGCTRFLTVAPAARVPLINRNRRLFMSGFKILQTSSFCSSAMSLTSLGSAQFA